MQTAEVPAPAAAGSSRLETDYPLTPAQIDAYRRDGFIQLDEVITGADLENLRNAVTALVDNDDAAPLATSDRHSVYAQVFLQKVNLWQRDPVIRAWACSPRLGNLAARLSGRPARLWHDQALYKPANTGAKTPWHQDAVYWPHAEREDQITVWIALRDATIRNGCMSFIPGSQTVRSAEAINLVDPKDIFEMAPQVRGVKPVTCELKAGSVTFHNGMSFHFAGPNRSEEVREAFAIIYMPDGTTFDGRGHIVTDPLGLTKGDVLEGEVFPLVG